MPELLTVTEVCDILGAHENTVYRYIADGRLIATRLGGTGPWRITRDNLERFIRGGDTCS
jgi:excisionase family DNA binding protein